MNYFEQLAHQVRAFIFTVQLVVQMAVLSLAIAVLQFTDLPLPVVFGIAAGLIIAGSLVTARLTSAYALEPMQALWQSIVHLNPAEHGIAAPDLNKLKTGRELVTHLSAQVYQLATMAESQIQAVNNQPVDLSRNFVANNLPLPFFVLDNTETITFANQAAADYIGMAPQDLVGKNVYMVLDMSFPSEDTFDRWLKDVKSRTATASQSWERVRLNVRDNHPTRMFDLASYYNKDNSQKLETMLVLFDHTEQYSQDDQAVSFIALSVHELRTPLTLLRGYIEVFEEELQDKATPELMNFMHKMSATSQQLVAFVNNILNVARVDGDQLELHLQSEDWATIIKEAVTNISLRARVRGISLECNIADNLPPVGVDRLSIYEVLNNLIDNAIKYSGTSKKIKIDTYLNTDGLVETTVQDYGLGITTSIMSNLFTKFYRDHRNRAQIGGTGLGLYLSKAIVDAHGGQIWVKSKPEEGSTFGFTLLPYAQLSAGAKQSGNAELVRGAHGWIKNHSLYRR